MLPTPASVWETSDMSEGEDLRGRELYEALIAIKPKGLVETDWAVQAGVNRGFFTNIKAAPISPRANTLRKLLRHIGKTEADLYAAAGSAQPEIPPARQAAEDDGTVELQRLDLSLSMGPGTLIDDYVEAEPVRFDPSFVRLITRAPYHRLKLVTGIGDSMYPTLNWGDTIMIDTTDRALAKQDAIYWISVYGASGLKRLRAIGKGRVLVVSDNPSVPDQEVDAEDLRIEGRAVWFARGL